MQTRTLLAAVTAAAIAAVAIPARSNAQDTTKTTSKGEVAMQPNFGSLISAINAAPTHTDKLEGMTDVTASNVQLVNVEDLLKGNDVNALNNALTRNQADVEALRTALGANTTINGVITSSPSSMATDAPKLTANDIVAADVAADGHVVLYYWKKP